MANVACAYFAPPTAPPTWLPRDPRCSLEAREASWSLGSQTQVQGVEAAPAGTLSCPQQFEASFVQRHWHSPNTSTGEESGLCSQQGDSAVVAGKSKASRCVEGVHERSVTAGTSCALAFLVCFCMPYRQAWKRKKDFWLHIAPLSHVAIVLGI